MGAPPGQRAARAARTAAGRLPAPCLCRRAEWAGCRGPVPWPRGPRLSTCVRIDELVFGREDKVTAVWSARQPYQVSMARCGIGGGGGRCRPQRPCLVSLWPSAHHPWLLAAGGARSAVPAARRARARAAGPRRSAHTCGLRGWGSWVDGWVGGVGPCSGDGPPPVRLSSRPAPPLHPATGVGGRVRARGPAGDAAPGAHRLSVGAGADPGGCRGRGMGQALSRLTSTGRRLPARDGPREHRHHSPEPCHDSRATPRRRLSAAPPSPLPLQSWNVAADSGSVAPELLGLLAEEGLTLRDGHGLAAGGGGGDGGGRGDDPHHGFTVRVCACADGRMGRA
jgi:hypothetical protein